MKATLKEIRTIVREELSKSRLDRAIELATEKHAGQFDKGGKEYIGHPLRVMKSCLAKGYDEDTAIAAVLHDTYEDTDLTLEEIEREFGKHVSDTVALLSKLPGEDYDAFVARIIASKNASAMKVKLEDLTDNMDASRLSKEPTEKDSQRIIKYKKAYALLTQALGEL